MWDIKKLDFKGNYPPKLDGIYLIRENLEKIDSRFLTHYTNLYFISHKDGSYIIDTGSGIFPLLDELKKINSSNIIALNTHGDFDHIGNNREFAVTLIHEKEVNRIQQDRNIEFLKDANHDKMIREALIRQNYLIHPAKNIEKIIDGDEISNGDIDVQVIYTPGHTIGSVCYKYDNIIFTGDTVHYGTVYIPNKLDDLIYSLKKLNTFVDSDSIILPGHGPSPITPNVISEMLEHIENIANNELQSYQIKYNNFLGSQIIETSNFCFVWSQNNN